MGYSSYRSLCRALNMGNVAHIHGVPLCMDPQVGELLTFAFYRVGRSEQHSGAPLHFCEDFAPASVLPGSHWRRWEGLPTCTVTSVGDHGVVYDSAENRPRSMELPAFLRNWAPHEAVPRETSVWLHRETRQVVQVLEATLVHAHHGQVHYVTSENRRETTPAQTFQRVYRQLPSPPEDHLWQLGDTLFQASRAGDRVQLQPIWPADATPLTLRSADLYLRAEAVTFGDIAFPVRRGSEWINKQTNATCRVLDIGSLRAEGATRYVRVDRGGCEHLEALDYFLGRHSLAPSPPPCKTGETWVHVSDTTRRCVIRKEGAPPLSQAVVVWTDGTVGYLPHESFSTEYTKLDTLSYWQLLDAEDD